MRLTTGLLKCLFYVFMEIEEPYVQVSFQHNYDEGVRVGVIGAGIGSRIRAGVGAGVGAGMVRESEQASMRELEREYILQPCNSNTRSSYTIDETSHPIQIVRTEKQIERHATDSACRNRMSVQHLHHWRATRS